MQTTDHRRERTTASQHRGVSVEWLALWVILALAFALSFRALFDVGRAAGLGSLAWALPVIVDGFAVLAARVIERLESRWARLYPWTLLIGLVCVSSWWNGLHAGGDVVLDPRVAAIVAGAPPVILGLAYHLLRMVTTAQPDSAGVDECATNDQNAPLAHPEAHELKVGAGEVNGDGRHIVVTRHMTIKERAWQWYQQQKASGHEPTAAQLVNAVGTSSGNARKLIAAFKQRWQHQQPAAADQRA